MFARTKRLLLRPGWIEDAPALASAIGEESIVRNLARAPWPYTEADAVRFLSQEQDMRVPNFLILSRTNGQPRLVGGIGLNQRADDRVELGYWIARPYWGLGFATEAGRAVMRIARASGLSGIVASHFIDNPASGNVLRKLGFRPTGQIVRRPSVGRGEDVTCALFEQGEDVAMPRDTHRHIYEDAAPLAA